MEFTLKTPVARSRAPGAGQGRAISAAQRAGRGREHLPGRARRRRRQPGSAGDAAARAHRAVLTTMRRRRSRRRRRTAERIRATRPRLLHRHHLGERRAKARLRRGVPDCGPRAYEWLREAMNWYEKPKPSALHGNDDALLRWNACARLIMRDRRLVPAPRRARRASAAGVTRAYFERWNGTLVTTMFGRKSSAPLMSSDVWLCSRCCHQRAGTNSGRMTVT